MQPDQIEAFPPAPEGEFSRYAEHQERAWPEASPPETYNQWLARHGYQTVTIQSLDKQQNAQTDSTHDNRARANRAHTPPR